MSQAEPCRPILRILSLCDRERDQEISPWVPLRPNLPSSHLPLQTYPLAPPPQSLWDMPAPRRTLWGDEPRVHFALGSSPEVVHAPQTLPPRRWETWVEGVNSERVWGSLQPVRATASSIVSLFRGPSPDLHFESAESEGEDFRLLRQRCIPMAAKDSDSVVGETGPPRYKYGAPEDLLITDVGELLATI